jgi:superfamily II DNA or RNA helicase/transcriptional regulator with XRE-family HTH domain
LSTMDVWPRDIRRIRAELGLTQSQLAEQLGVTIATVSRWENAQSRPNRLAIRALANLSSHAPVPILGALAVREPSARLSFAPPLRTPDFQSDPRLLRVCVEGQRLLFGHLFSSGFATETSLIDPLPHQILAVYDSMLSQPRLRLLLADDAGAGKTIMTGLYIREMLSRHLIRRVLVVPPAGLVGNWKREMARLFSLRFREITGADCTTDNPFAMPGSDLALISIDTLTGERPFHRLASPDTPAYDLVVFDEAHKLSAFRNADGSHETTERYKLAELLAGAPALRESREHRRLHWHAHHLLLLTATPHMGKEFPFYALWRLLEPHLLPTIDAFNATAPEFRSARFLRRTKEEMVRFDESKIFPTRESGTTSYDLSAVEQELYDELTSYVRSHYNRARVLNRSAARLAMSVLQRRAASSTWAILRSLQRRLERLDEYITAFLAEQLRDESFVAQQRGMRLRSVEDDKTSDEEAAVDGKEERDSEEDEAMRGTASSTLAELQAERIEVQRLIGLAKSAYEAGEESKFEKLREVIQDERFRGEKILVFTEHRDTMEFLVRKLEAMGYTGEVTSIHGGMPYSEREAQMEAFRTRCRFMIATDAAGEGINLQFCWIMVNYDIPWNPARIEQRFGRIHRYKQRHDPVVLINLVAGKTREGRVLRTLLDKLERIRKELGSDKVFDVIGRQFQGISLTDLLMHAVTEDAADAASKEIEGVLTVQQTRAIAEADARLRATGGDVASQLPTLRARMEQDQLHRLLPGYVRHFISASAPHLGVEVDGDLDGQFTLRNLPFPLALALEESAGGRGLLLTATKPDVESDLLFVRPGEPFFDNYRAYFAERFSEEALSGAAFIDPYAVEPYLYHLARITVVRSPDPELAGAFGAEHVLDIQLVALKQALDGRSERCAVELPMVLQLTRSTPAESLPSTVAVQQCLGAAQTYLEQEVARPAAERLADGLRQALRDREAFLRAAFDYQAAELMGLRSRLREQADGGKAEARRDLETVKDRQKALTEEKERALAVLSREPELMRIGEVSFLAHALVLPSSDPEERERHDREIEQIAVNVVRAYEESFGATIHDVSDPVDKIGFDLLSRRPNGDERCIEVKGRRAIGDIELSENEWAKAANLREKYWLYVVYDCAALHPRLLRIQDPFLKLIVKARGGVIVDEQAVFQAAEG